MTDRPILYSGPMVVAQMEGRKGQTRRILKDAPTEPGWMLYVEANGAMKWVGPNGYPSMPCVVRFAKGDRLWVRETWRTGKSLDDASPAKIATMCQVAGWKQPWCPIKYEADGATVNADALRGFGGEWGKTRVAIHMPRWASRLTDIVTDVRVQRLQEISEEDARAEGMWSYEATDCDGDPRADGKLYRQTFWHWRRDIEQGDGYSTAVSAYRHLWGDINGTGSWDTNPWIVALTFKVHHCNIDQVPPMPIDMTEIEELERLLEKATQGPFTALEGDLIDALPSLLAEIKRGREALRVTRMQVEVRKAGKVALSDEKWLAIIDAALEGKDNVV